MINCLQRFRILSPMHAKVNIIGVVSYIFYKCLHLLQMNVLNTGLASFIETRLNELNCYSNKITVATFILLTS